MSDLREATPIEPQLPPDWTVASLRRATEVIRADERGAVMRVARKVLRTTEADALEFELECELGRVGLL